MQKLGYFLIAGGFLGGSFYIVQNKDQVALAGYFICLAIGLVGVTMARLAGHKAARHEDKLVTDVESIRASLARLAENADKLEAEKDSIDVYELRHRIDAVFADDIRTFVEARESIAHSYSLDGYAEVMSHFAAGERHLNRVWSTSTDGYVDEAHEYIARAAEQLNEARQAFEGLGTERGFLAAG